MWTRFEEVHRSRPVQLVGRERDTPFAAVEVELSTGDLSGRVVARLTVGGLRLEGWYDATRSRCGIDITDPAGITSRHRSRRHGRTSSPPQALGVMLTGRQVTVLTRGDGEWTARGKVVLEHDVDPEHLTADVAGRPADTDASAATTNSPVASWRSGTSGQLGVRDVHLVTHADGTPYERDGWLFLALTHAGPGFFATARCGVWAFDPETFRLEHRSDLWFRRDGVVRGDHATHVVRDGDRWLVASSTWSTFDDGDDPAGRSVGICLATSDEDLLHGEHVLESTPLDVPLHRLPPPVVGCWDPHLTRIDGHWHLAFVAARTFFDFYPVLARARAAGGPTDWELIGAATERTATEGTTIIRVGADWRVLASDGPEGPRGLRRRFPVFDLAMREVDVLDAEHPTNIPWPTVIQRGDHALLVTFDGTAYGGTLPGYGTHGDFVVLRTKSVAAASHPATPLSGQERS
ncbi:hypothetical protein ncot_01700 [Nocardioides sp. JQ2195]|uniref:hypothetical protein n=1 Tax=Nocardioides sp. JQ2195 TaxID=2592334 RepID=UPI00143E7A4F|nr:hypothetical protein [Nocardioides sp. JQ2195]QIX25444.1 hypothetical protein ncot_01700 [Nocardioides sp. JQ2195]